MAILQALLAVLTRSAGRLINMAFGWATVLLFGKVPQDRQIYLSAISFGSVLWLIATVGTIFPGFATWLLAFVRPPQWIQDTWIRWAMMAAAALLPLLIGFVSVRLVDAEDRPKGAGATVAWVLRGYLYTIGLALTLLLMTVLAPLMKARDLVRRWTSAHVPIMVEPRDYASVVDDVQRALAAGDLHTTRRPASWMIRVPTRVLTLFARGAVENLAGEQLVTLVGDDLEVLLHPSDLVISGRALDVARARAILAEQLTFTRGYLTWSREANELEDRLRAIWEGLRARPAEASTFAAQLAEVEASLRSLRLPFEEWEVLFREKVLVERGVLQVQAGIVGRPREPAEASPEASGAAAAARAGRAGPRLSVARLPLVAALLTFAVVLRRGLTGKSRLA